MARVSTYLNFSRNTEEMFNFYKSFFGAILEYPHLYFSIYKCVTITLCFQSVRIRRENFLV